MPSPAQWTGPWLWLLEPAVLVGLEVAALLYVVGGLGGRRRTRPAGFDRWRAVVFWCGLAFILVALDGPIGYFAGQLFWVHMAQHILLTTVAAPLLALSAPWLRMWRGLPRGIRRPVARAAALHPALAPARRLLHLLGRPAPIWVLAAADLLAWHVPGLYDLTLRDHLLHHLEHASFLLFGLAFWAQVADRPPFRSRLSHLHRAAYVFTAMLPSWILAMVLSFAATPFYAYALLPSRPGGISALTDQQLGGGLMWVPAAIPYAIAVAVHLSMWLGPDEGRTAAAVE